MSEIAERYRKVAAQFTRRVRSVPDGAWDAPAPCEGWVARDVVGHMVAWMAGFFPDDAGVEVPSGPSANEDPRGAWEALDAAIQAALDDPDVARRQVELRPGRYTVEQAVADFMIGDVLVHTWDLARATGLDEVLDPDEVRSLLVTMEPVDDLMRTSGHFGPRVEVPDDADEQTRLLAFTGRRP